MLANVDHVLPLQLCSDALVCRPVVYSAFVFALLPSSGFAVFFAVGNKRPLRTALPAGWLTAIIAIAKNYRFDFCRLFYRLFRCRCVVDARVWPLETYIHQKRYTILFHRLLVSLSAFDI